MQKQGVWSGYGSKLSVVLFVSSCQTTAMNQVKNMIKTLEPGLKSHELIQGLCVSKESGSLVHTVCIYTLIRFLGVCKLSFFTPLQFVGHLILVIYTVRSTSIQPCETNRNSWLGTLAKVKCTTALNSARQNPVQKHWVLATNYAHSEEVMKTFSQLKNVE